MNIRDLNQLEFKYVRIRLDGESQRYENENFTNLLNFIGEHYPINNRNNLGCAYFKIRKETDKLLRVSRGHNWKLRTSKNEIRSIRFAKYWVIENRNNHYYIRIPYKISYIFTAIINIVNEINKEHPIPDNLKSCIGQAYGLSFYNFHIDEYEKEYRRKFKYDAENSPHKTNPSKLHDEFFAPTSVFKEIFC